MLSNDGDRNIVDSVDYIVSGIWKHDTGKDKVGAVMIQEEQIFAARDVQKGDDRPGGYVATAATEASSAVSTPSCSHSSPRRNTPTFPR